MLYRGDEILVFEARDEVKAETFYRPLGGEVEFGERSRDTVSRELSEEIGAEIRSLRFMTVLENLFTYNGKPGHEIVLVYEAEFADASFYKRNEFLVTEDNGETLPARWMRLGLFKDGKAPLYPDGLLEFLETHGKVIRRRRR